MQEELSKWRVWWKIKFQCWIPKILTIDSKYRVVEKSKIKEKYICDNSLNQAFEFNYFECDEYAWILKALVHKDRLNGIGFIFGLYIDKNKKIWGHAWNVFISETGEALQVDPMLYVNYVRNHNNEPPPEEYYMFKRRTETHLPYLVII